MSPPLALWLPKRKKIRKVSKENPYSFEFPRTLSVASTQAVSRNTTSYHTLVVQYLQGSNVAGERCRSFFQPLVLDELAPDGPLVLKGFW